MAVVKTGVSPTQSALYFVEESTFGTAVVTSMIQLKTLDGSTPGIVRQQFVDRTMANAGTNVIDTDDFYMTENGVWQTYSIPEFLCTAEIASHMLFAAVQDVVEADVTNIKTFSGNSDSLALDFSSSPAGGYFFTFLRKDAAVAGNSQRMVSCVLDSLTFRVNRENGGRLSASAVVRSGKALAQGAINTETTSTSAIPNYYDAVSTLAIGGNDLSWESAELTVKNTWDWLGNASGAADNYKLMKQEFTGTFTVKHDSNAASLYTLDGTDVGGTTLTLGTNSVDGYFVFTSAETWMNSYTIESSGDTVQKAVINCEFMMDGSNYPSFVTFDNIDHTWPNS